ncbi:MAG: phosphate transport system substrate-binding protein [Verrucomicrobiota bacterium]
MSLFRNFAALLLAMVLSSCSPRTTETISILGSNTFGEELAPRLTAEYKKDHPGIDFRLEFKGTSYGFGGLMVDRCDIAAASREATTNERGLARDRSIEFNQYIIGSYSIAVVVNANNTVTNLSPEQVRDIFTGAIHNWKDVGGADSPIHVYARDPISGTHLGFQELAMEKKPYVEGFKTFTNYTSIVQSVVQDPNGIGYASLQLSAKPGMKSLSIGGAPATAETVQKGTYPYARVLRLYTNKAAEKPAAREFIDFVQSTSGQKILDEMGFVSHP